MSFFEISSLIIGNNERQILTIVLASHRELQLIVEWELITWLNEKHN